MTHSSNQRRTIARLARVRPDRIGTERSKSSYVLREIVLHQYRHLQKKQGFE